MSKDFPPEALSEDLPPLYSRYRAAMQEYYLSQNDDQLRLAAAIYALGRFRFGPRAWDDEQRQFFSSHPTTSKRKRVTLEDLFP